MFVGRGGFGGGPGFARAASSVLLPDLRESAAAWVFFRSILVRVSAEHLIVTVGVYRELL